MSLAGVLNDVTGIAEGYAGGGISVAVKTNYSPRITVYSSGASSGGGSGGGGAGSLLGKLIGLQVGVTVTDNQGRTLATYGPDNGDPPTDWVRVVAAVILLGVVAMGAAVLIRSV